MRHITRSIIATACFAAALAGGCVGYGTYPRAGGALSPTGVNSAAGEEIMVAAAQWILRYDFGSVEAAPEVVLNLPSNVSDRRAVRIANAVGANVSPASAEALTATKPVYHIGRMALRGNLCDIDVYRPVFDRPDDVPILDPESPPGEPVYQCITLTVRGGDQPWAVERSRPWALGAFAAPVITIVEPPPPTWPRGQERPL